MQIALMRNTSGSLPPSTQASR
jgi:hypothetical protein